MKAGDIVLFYGKGLWGWIVNKLTKGKYVHVEIILTDNISMKVYAGGITVNIIQKDKIGKVYDIYRPYYSPPENNEKAVRHAMRLINETPKYGFLNLMAFAFIRVLRKLKIRWFEGDKFMTCSEAVSDCLDYAGMVKRIDIPSSLITPNDEPRVYRMCMIKDTH